jgi:hypothetical protein
MTCETNGTNKKITRGEDFTLIVRMRDKYNDPIDLTNMTAAEATFPGESSDVVKTLGAGISVVGNAILGKFQVVLDEADTLLLNIGNNQEYKIKTVISTETKIDKFNDLDVISEALS